MCIVFDKTILLDFTKVVGYLFNTEGYFKHHRSP